MRRSRTLASGGHGDGIARQRLAACEPAGSTRAGISLRPFLIHFLFISGSAPRVGLAACAAGISAEVGSVIVVSAKAHGESMIDAMFARQATDGLVAERKSYRCELDWRRHCGLRMKQGESGAVEAGRHRKPEEKPNEQLAHQIHPLAESRRRCGRSRQFAFRSRSPYCPQAASLTLRATRRKSRLRAHETFADCDCRNMRLNSSPAAAGQNISCAPRARHSQLSGHLATLGVPRRTRRRRLARARGRLGRQACPGRCGSWREFLPLSGSGRQHLRHGGASQREREPKRRNSCRGRSIAIADMPFRHLPLQDLDDLAAVLPRRRGHAPTPAYASTCANFPCLGTYGICADRQLPRKSAHEKVLRRATWPAFIDRISSPARWSAFGACGNLARRRQCDANLASIGR